MALGPKEINQTNISLIDVSQKIRFNVNPAGRNTPGLATVNGIVPIAKGTTYMLSVAATGLNFKLNQSTGSDAANAVGATDMFIPANTIFYFWSGEFDQFVCNQTTGILTPLAI